MTQAAPVQTAEINSIEGLDQYLSKNQDGTISLDESAAQDAGYTQEAIAYVQENISYMNDMARTKGAYIDDQFKMIYAEGPMTRARGVNKVEMLWNGNIDIYMDSDQAEVYVDGVEKAIAEAEKLGGNCLTYCTDVRTADWSIYIRCISYSEYGENGEKCGDRYYYAYSARLCYTNGYILF